MADTVNLKLLITTQLKGQESFGNAKSGFLSIGNAAMMAAAAVAALAAVGIVKFFKDSIEAAAEFSDTMMMVKAATNATEDQMAALTEEANRIGREFGKFTAKDAAEGMRNLAYYGFSVEEAMVAVDSVMKLAQAGMMDLGAAASIVAGSLRSYGFDAKDAKMITDIMAKTFISSGATMEELGESIKMVGPVASAAGVDFEELNAVLGILAKSNIKGTQAGTYLREVILSLQGPTEEAKAILKKLGIELFRSTEASTEAGIALEKDKQIVAALGVELDSTRQDIKEFEAALAKLAVDEQKNSLEVMMLRQKITMETQKYNDELSRMQVEMEKTQQSANKLQTELDILNITESENNLEIMKLRNDAAEANRENTAAELQSIAELELKNKLLSETMAEKSLQLSELSLQEKEYQDQMDGVSSTIEEVTQADVDRIATLESANESLSIIMASTEIQMAESRIAETELVKSHEAAEQAVRDDTLAVQTLQGALKSINEVALEFAAATEGMSDAQKSDALATMFSKRSIGAFTIIMRAATTTMADGRTELEAFTEALEESEGTVDKISDTMETSLGNRILAATSAFESFQLNIVAGMMPALDMFLMALKNDVIPALDPLIPIFTELATAMMPFIQIFLTAFQEVVIPLFIEFTDIFFPMIPMVLEFLLSLQTWAISAGTVSIIMKAFGDILNSMLTIFISLGPAIKIAGDITQKFWVIIEKLVVWVAELAAVFAEFAGPVLNAILVPVLEMVLILLDAMIPIIDAIILVINALMPLFVALTPVLTELITAAMEPLKQVIISLVPLFTSIAEIIIILIPLIEVLVELIIVFLPLLELLIPVIAMLVPLIELLIMPLTVWAEVTKYTLIPVVWILNGLLGALVIVMGFIVEKLVWLGNWVNENIIDIWTEKLYWLVDALKDVGGWLERLIGYIGDLNLDKVSEMLGLTGGSGGGLQGRAEKLLGFDEGGVVPGNIGEPMMILAHGGEEVIPVGKGGSRGVSYTSHDTINISLHVDKAVSDEDIDRIDRLLAERFINYKRQGMHQLLTEVD